MRSDILVDVTDGNVKMRNLFTPTCVFTPVSETPAALRGRLTFVSKELADAFVRKSEARFTLPYIPSAKPVDVTFSYGAVTLLGGAVFRLCDTSGNDVRACSLGLIGANGNFTARIVGDRMALSCGDEWDFLTGDANGQNKAFLLECSPGSSYRYPTVGVDLRKWLNSPTHMNGLSRRLVEEFAKDGTPVTDAAYDPESGRLNVTLDTNNV